MGLCPPYQWLHPYNPTFMGMCSALATWLPFTKFLNLLQLGDC